MARYLRTPRYPFDQSAKFSEIAPVGRATVSPGETLKQLKFGARMQSLPIKYSLMGAYINVSFYYVPLRLVWPEFEDFILNKGGTVPTLTAGQSSFFCSLGGKSKLYGLCYEEVVNRYFRSDETDLYSYDGSLARNMRADRLAESSFVANADTDDVTINIADGLTVDEIDEARAENRYNKRMSAATGHYSDFLRMNGVNARAATVSEPEFIGHVRKFLQPSKSIDNSTGFTVQSYFTDVDLKLTKPRLLPEHGFIVGVMTLDPVVGSGEARPVDILWDTPEMYPHQGQPERLREYHDEAGDLSGFTDPDVKHHLDNYMTMGQNLSTGVTTADMFAEYTVSNAEQARFVPTSTLAGILASPSTLQSGDQYQVKGYTSLKVLSPTKYTKRK